MSPTDPVPGQPAPSNTRYAVTVCRDCGGQGTTSVQWHAGDCPQRDKPVVYWREVEVVPLAALEAMTAERDATEAKLDALRDETIRRGYGPAGVSAALRATLTGGEALEAARKVIQEMRPASMRFPSSGALAFAALEAALSAALGTEKEGR